MKSRQALINNQLAIAAEYEHRASHAYEHINDEHGDFFALIAASRYTYAVLLEDGATNKMAKHLAEHYAVMVIDTHRLPFDPSKILL